MNFRVGQKVVCISQTNPAAIAAYPEARWPELNGIYTIRTINYWPIRNATLLTFAEIDNGHMVPSFSRIEPGFGQKHFRPLVERKTDTGFAVLEEIRCRETVPAQPKQRALTSTK